VLQQPPHRRVHVCRVHRQARQRRLNRSCTEAVGGQPPVGACQGCRRRPSRQARRTLLLVGARLSQLPRDGTRV
jgi:hypothetical protein